MDYYHSLERFVIKLKNIIFFKVVMCIISILLLLWYWNFIREEYQQELLFLENANNKLVIARTKLQYAAELQGKLAEIQSIYYNIQQGITKDKCTKRTILFGNLEKLASKYNLSQSISLKMSKIFSKSYPELISNNVSINNYNLVIEFLTVDFMIVDQVAKEIASFLDSYDRLVTVQGELQEVLTPEKVATLSETSMPSMVQAKIIISLKEVNVNK